MLVHGGAWGIPDEEVQAHTDGVRVAIERARQMLEAGRPALDVVEEVVASLESDPAFNAGRGGVLDRDGLVQLDAGIMNGPTLAWGAVAGLRATPNPVRVARLLVGGDGRARLLVGEGAERFAAEHGLPHVEPSRLIVPREVERRAVAEAPQGTVGCVALDQAGSLAVASSTGGTPGAIPGRVGDTPLVGSGFYADGSAAVCATGWGEPLATVQIASRVASQVDLDVRPDDAAAQALDAMRRCVGWADGGATGGLLVLGADGAGGWAFTTPRMARGGWASGSAIWTAVD